ncbi:hypothetical protein MKX01_030566 [Papaver californicum]|nr:hypothetical protein MKX01_030566 [Papaver californicum]
MERNNSYGASWDADQWDYHNPDRVSEKKKKKFLTLGGSGDGEGTNKYGKKIGDGLEKTKQVAITGAKKVKKGATFGFLWVKEKYNKRTQNRDGGGGGTNTYGKKVGDGLEKTKEVAITGAKKFKDGATFGFQWLKEKYNKRTQNTSI